MNDLAEFLALLFERGAIHFRQPPAHPAAPAPAPEVLRLIERAYAAYRLEVPGRPIALDYGVACAAAEVVRQASWALVCHHERIEDLERRLAMPHAPATAAHHLSGDLLLRYLPQVLRRARALDPADVLVGLIERVLRQWPLSGVLAGLEEGPAVPLDWDGHEGLMLLYAERLAQNGSRTPHWRPAGRALEYVELVAGMGMGDRPPAHARPYERRKPT